MAKGDLYTGQISGLEARPKNCDKDLGTKERCPHCGQFHLRLGYCQALDPQKSAIDAGRDAWIKRRAEELRVFHANFDDETLSDNFETLTQEIETLTPDETLKPTEVSVSGKDSVSVVPLNYCEVCGGSFEAKRRTAKYCSPACRLKAHRGPEGVS